MKLNIGFVFDLRKDYLAEGYSEEQVGELDSEITIDSIEEVLRGLGHTVDRVGHGRELCRRLSAGDRWDLVFNIAEGLRGRSREAQVPGILELFGIPYTFSDPLVCAVTLDKAIAKRIVTTAGVPTPAFAVIRAEQDVEGVRLRYPLFAKPIAEGTGKGIDHRSKVSSPEALRDVCRHLLTTFRQPVLVEEYLPGREFTTGILGTGADARVLGTLGFCIRPGAPTNDYSFEVKERCDEFVDYFSMERGALRDAVERVALDAYRVLECRDGGRVDVRLDPGGQPSFIEVNPLPGLNPAHSDLPMIATYEGVSFASLIGSIVASAARRIGEK